MIDVQYINRPGAPAHRFAFCLGDAKAQAIRGAAKLQASLRKGGTAIGRARPTAVVYVDGVPVDKLTEGGAS